MENYRKELKMEVNMRRKRKMENMTGFAERMKKV